MPQPAQESGVSKFVRYRRSKQSQGLKLLRIWVPDPNAPGFAHEAREQAARLRGAPEETEILGFIEAAIQDGGWPAGDTNDER